MLYAEILCVFSEFQSLQKITSIYNYIGKQLILKGGVSTKY